MENHSTEVIADGLTERAKNLSALVISLFAATLAITGVGGKNAEQDALHSNIQAANAYNFFQAKNARQTIYKVELERVETELQSPEKPLTKERKARLESLSDKYKKTIERYESEPSTNEGKKELLQRAKEQEAVRDASLNKNPYFDLSEALLQIAIVLISVFLITGRRVVAMAGGASGLAGILLTVYAFML